ncbi:TatD family hydrolase [Algicola sagamiensis]|uniref:TatD family hydrolase n=1 Tax=Algicola sagamiensis TaxID=163869 RepID=UPI0003781AD7|nr:TatD family hydrolase [Algicola sagamiensis]
MPFIDSHCHLDFPDFDQDRDEVIQSCQKQGIVRCILPGTSHLQMEKQLALKGAYPDWIDIAFGLHPYMIESQKKEDVEAISKMIASHSKTIVALGEIGLDKRFPLWEEQVRVFERQVELAQDFQLPLILHHQKSQDTMLGILRKKGFSHGGVIHAFSGSLQQAQQWLALGFKLGLGGTVTYLRAQKTRQVVKELPLDSFVLETDAPDMPVYGYQGQRNSPERLLNVFQSLTSLRNEDGSVIERQVYQNTCDIFGSVKPLGDDL